ncbi:MAG: sulfurtransferase TusA family protein [Gammaproteobacteria bacterium]|jgi:tRNA 2-thiouridine synthesizing protein A
MSNRQALDARHLLCPLPLIRVQDRIKTMVVGNILEVSCTDPGTLHDIPTWCRLYGHRLLHTYRNDPVFVFTIEVGDADVHGDALPQAKKLSTPNFGFTTGVKC